MKLTSDFWRFIHFANLCEYWRSQGCSDERAMELASAETGVSYGDEKQIESQR